MAPPGEYSLPPWSAVPPAGSYSVEIIREGVVMETLDISAKSHYQLGRDPAGADICLPHPSVSRRHAVLQHRDSGGVWLMDLGSTHGTTLNKKPCPPHAYVRLHVGASVRLGTGSRLVCLIGPPDDGAAGEGGAGERSGATRLDDAARIAARAERIAKTSGRSTVKAEDLHAGGAGWGFDEDAAEEARDEDDSALESLSFDTLLQMARAAQSTRSQQRRPENFHPTAKHQTDSPTKNLNSEAPAQSPQRRSPCTRRRCARPT